MSQDQGAVVCCLRADRRVRIRGAKRSHNESLRRLPTSIEAAIRNVRDAISIHNDKRVGRWNGGVYRISPSINKRRNHTLHNVAREEWAHRSVDQDDVAIRRLQRVKPSAR